MSTFIVSKLGEALGEAKRKSEGDAEEFARAVEPAPVQGFDPQAFLKRLEEQPVTQEDSFDPKAMLGKLGVDREQAPLTEAERDIQEVSERPSPTEFGLKAGQAAVGEVKGLAKGSAALVGALAKDLLIMKTGNVEKNKDLYNRRRQQAVEVIKQSPELAKEMLVDLGTSFGYEKGRGFDVDVALDKFQRAPIEAVLDVVGLATIAGGIARKAGKTVGKPLLNAAQKSKFMPNAAKELAKDIIAKGNNESLQLAQNIAKKDVSDSLQDLYKERKILKDMSISKQLDNPNYAEELGRGAIEKVNQMKQFEQRQLKREIGKISDKMINKTPIQNELKTQLEKAHLLKKGPDGKLNHLDTDLIEEGLSKKLFTTELEMLNRVDEPLTAGQLHKRMRNISDKINFRDPKVADEGLKAIRKVYRNQLRSMSPEYNELALQVHKKLDLFEPQLKRFKKVGAGEKFGKKTFQTKEELNEFINLVENSNIPESGALLADLKTLKSWQAWNRYFKQNPDFVIGKVPLLPESFSGQVKKRLIKGDLKAGKAARAVISAPFKGLKTVRKKGKVPIRVGLELTEEEE